MTKSDARIEGIVAREANIAVIFRRGPTRQTQMLFWDLNTDEVTPGQWIRARVNVRRCDVTPDGRLLVAGLYDVDSRRHAANVHPHNAEGWTAISRPPYFTALALWFESAGMGGSWSSARDLHLFGELANDEPDKGRLDRRIRRHGLASDQRIFDLRLRRDGWRQLSAARHRRLTAEWRSDTALVQELNAAEVNLVLLEAMRRGEFPHYLQLGTARWEREFPGGRLERLGTGESEETVRLYDEAGELRRERIHAYSTWDWVDLDARERLIYSEQGGLWVWQDFPDGKPNLIADLNANAFAPVEPPDWALEWPTDTPPEW